MTDKVYIGDTIGRVITFTNASGTEFDPDAIEIYILDPTGMERQGEEPIDKSDLENPSVGVFKLYFTIPEESPQAGVWTIKVIGQIIEADVVVAQGREDFPFVVEE